MKKSVQLALLVAVLGFSLAFSTPRPVQALRCCEGPIYATSLYQVVDSTCSRAQAAFRAAALPEAQAICDPEFVCAITIPACYAVNGGYAVTGSMFFGCTYYCEIQ